MKQIFLAVLSKILLRTHSLAKPEDECFDIRNTLELIGNRNNNRCSACYMSDNEGKENEVSNNFYDSLSALEKQNELKAAMTQYDLYKYALFFYERNDWHEILTLKHIRAVHAYQTRATSTLCVRARAPRVVRQSCGKTCAETASRARRAWRARAPTYVRTYVRTWHVYVRYNNIV